MMMRAATDRLDSAWECPGWAKTGQALVRSDPIELAQLIMSGFDDLLQQSSRALEENPFEDPFARPRPGSPDPWSSYDHQSVAISTPTFDEYDASGFGSVPTTTHVVGLHDDTLSSPTVESHTYNTQTTPSDPLDSANLPADDETEFSTKPATSPRYAAFRESVGTDPSAVPSQPSAASSEPFSEPDPPSIVPPTLPSIISPPATTPLQLSSPVTPSSAIPTESVEHTAPPSPPPPSSARLPQRQEALHPSAHLPFDTSSSTASDSHRVISSPLDRPPVAAFASLALGGESFNGFDGAQSAFVNHASHPSTTQEEEDDDDDKPLLPRPVSNSFYFFLVGVTHERSKSDGTPRKERNRTAASVHHYRRRSTEGWRPHPCVHHVYSSHQGTLRLNSLPYRLSSTCLPDRFCSIFQAFFFRSSSLFGLSMAVRNRFDQ